MFPHAKCEAGDCLMAAMVHAHVTTYLHYNILPDVDHVCTIERVHQSTQRSYLGMDAPTIPGFELRLEDGRATHMTVFTADNSEQLPMRVSNPKRISDYE